MALRIVGVVIDIRAVIYKNPYGFDLPVRYRSAEHGEEVYLSVSGGNGLRQHQQPEVV